MILHPKRIENPPSELSLLQKWITTILMPFLYDQFSNISKALARIDTSETTTTIGGGSGSGNSGNNGRAGIVTVSGALSSGTAITVNFIAMDNSNYVPSGVLLSTNGISPAIPIIPDGTSITDSRTPTSMQFRVYENGKLIWTIQPQ